MKKVTCGTIIMTPDLKYVLLGHSTNNIHWDIFKGIQESDELPIETALRELKEETSLNHIHDLFLSDLGRYQYNTEKDIHLFIMFTQQHEIDIKKMKCVSMVTKLNGKAVEPFPEMDKFAWIPVSEIHLYLSKRLNNLLQEILLNNKF